MPFKEATFWYRTLLFGTGLYFWVVGGDRMLIGIILTLCVACRNVVRVWVPDENGFSATYALRWTVASFLAPRIVAVQLDQHCIIHLCSKGHSDRRQIDPIPVCRELDAMG